ncbi:MAG: hypothetical protein U1F00_05190 [Rhodoferax sp.]
MKKEVIVRLHASFEELVQHDETGSEFWLARDLQELLGYARWENFEGVVRRAEQLVLNGAATGSLAQCSRTVAIGSGAIRNIVDYRLDRDGVELLGLLSTSFKLNGFFLARNETVLLGLLAKWATGKGLIAKAQFRLGPYTFDLMIADKLLLEFDEPHHDSSRQQSVDVAKDIAAKSAGFETLRLGLSNDVVDAILAIESSLEREASTTEIEAKLVIQRVRIAGKAKDFANEITNFNIKRDGLSDEPTISREHVKNNKDVRDLLGQRGNRPEAMPAAEDIKKIERRLTFESKKLPKTSKK